MSNPSYDDPEKRRAYEAGRREWRELRRKYPDMPAERLKRIFLQGVRQGAADGRAQRSTGHNLHCN